MTDEPIVMPEPVSKSAMINKIMTEIKTTDTSELPLGFDSGEEGALPTSPVTAADTAPAEPKVEVKESKSAKAARESKALRQARAKEVALQSQLEQANLSKKEVEDFKKIQELAKTNPKEALKLLGSDPLQAYQQMTDAWLQKDPEMQAKDPVQEKLKELDPYVEAIKKREAAAIERENQDNIRNMINTNVLPVLAKAEEYECLFGYFDPDNSMTPEQVKNVVAKSIFENAETYFKNTLGGDHNKLKKEFGNYETYFKKVADHLEKQVEQELEKMVQRTAKLNKFKSKFQQQSAKETVSEETNSSELPTLDAVVNSSSKTQDAPVAWQAKDITKAAAIQALLKKNNLA